MKKKLDSIDRQILAILQRDAETPLADMAQAVNLFATDVSSMAWPYVGDS